MGAHKYLLGIILCFISTIGYSQWFSGSNINSVKEGIFDIDPSVTVGKALDTWSTCLKTRWDEEKNKRDQIFITFYCEANFNSVKNGLKTTISNIMTSGTEEISIPDYASGRNILNLFDPKTVRFEDYLSILNYEKAEIFLEFIINLDDTFDYTYGGMLLYFNDGSILASDLDVYISNLSDSDSIETTLLYSAYTDEDITKDPNILDQFLTTTLLQNMSE
jgi:hypothetical protein